MDDLNSRGLEGHETLVDCSIRQRGEGPKDHLVSLPSGGPRTTYRRIVCDHDQDEQEGTIPRRSSMPLFIGEETSGPRLRINGRLR